MKLKSLKIEQPLFGENENHYIAELEFETKTTRARHTFDREFTLELLRFCKDKIIEKTKADQEEFFKDFESL